MNEKIIELRKKIKKVLDKERYEHTKGVMYTAGCLAMAHEYPIEKAMIAGLLHDCAKCVPTEEKFNLCNEHHVLINQVEMENPGLLHAKVGAVLAETKYKIKDPEILHAIKVHTTGEPDMNTLDKIIYIADYIEPRRNKAANLAHMRQLAFIDLDRALYEIMAGILQYLEETHAAIDKQTQEACIYYRDCYKDSKKAAF